MEKVKQDSNLTELIERQFLPFVRRPSRYIGGEINQIKKNLSSWELTIALCFADTYEVGMSNTGIAILYEVLNDIAGVAVERVFAPWLDAEKILRQKQIPLFTLESRAAVKTFDVIGFSLTTELCYTNVLNMLDLAGLQVRSSNRGEDDPLVIAGGGMANCCEPIADFIDMFVLGEGEQAVVELAELIKTEKKKGSSKGQILLEAAKQFEWVYVPQFYKFEYANSKIKSFTPVVSELRSKFENTVIEDFESAAVPLHPIVPFAETIHERVSVEIMRGCPRRCRFCQASFCRRPVRYRSIDKIVDIAKASYAASGFDTVSLLSLSSADYPRLEELVTKLHEYFKDKFVGLSMPSLRVDKQLKLIPKLVSQVRKSGLTIAVEAAGEKLRRIINKPLKDSDLFAAVESAYKAGWQKLKLYFMVGLPGETQDDIKNIVELSFQLARLRKNIDGKTAQINITISWFVPKPHTPFGWLEQKPKEYFEKAKELILDEKKKLRANFLHFKFHKIERSILESAIGRGDRRLCEVIEHAWREGAKFDLWDECFDPTIWQRAFEKFGFSIDELAQRKFVTNEILPWQHLAGPDKKYLLKHLDDSVDKIKSADKTEG